MSKQKPPIGLLPEFIFEHNKNMERVDDLLKACGRYAGAKKPIPAKWIDELHRRVSEAIKPIPLHEEHRT